MILGSWPGRLLRFAVRETRGGCGERSDEGGDVVKSW